MPQLDPRSIALVLIDLQKGVLGMPLAPRPAADVLEASRKFARRFREARAPVILVHVAFSDDFKDGPSKNVDQPLQRAADAPSNWSELADGLAAPGDILIVKHQWGAFYGTDLDLQLRRRGIKTIVLGGIATNFGVESTARDAWERHYDVVIAEDLCASMSAELHEFALRAIFPRLARVVTSGEIDFAAG